MRTLKFLSLVLILFLFSSGSVMEAQTFQKELTAVINNEPVACLNKLVSGTWTYHINYHVNPKTGELKNVHWNVLHSDLWDSDGN